MSMRHLLEQHARYNPDAIAIRDGEVVLTYQQLRERSLRLAGALHSQGLKAGDRVAWLIDVSCHQNYELYFACCYGRYIATPMNARMTVSELQGYAKYTEPSVVVANSTMLESAGAAVGSVPVVHAATDGSDCEYESLLAEHSAAPDVLPDDPNACVLLSPTSGTSGATRAAMLSQNNTYRAGLSWLWPLGLKRHSRITMGVPMYFASGSPGHFLFLFAGGEFIVLPRYTPEGFADLVERHQITHALTGPAMLYQLLDAAVDLSRLSSLKMLGAGGAVFDESRFRTLIERLGPKIFAMYGLTESAATATILAPEDYMDPDGHLNDRATSAGKPYPGIDLSVTAPSGKQVPHDGREPGVVRLSGEAVSSGYWRLPGQTSEVFDGDTVDTGDIGVIDEKGFLHIVDRAKDIIVSGGINVSSVEVERRIGSHPEVAHCAVIGVPHPQWGEAVHAVVVRRRRSSLTEDDVIAWARETLAGYKKPQSVEFLDELPMNSNGKVLKRDLRAKYWQETGKRVG